MRNKCPKCSSVLKPSNASYCITCGSYLNIDSNKIKLEKKSEKSHGCTLCGITIAFFVAYIITLEIWASTPVGSLEEFIADIILYVFFFAFFSSLNVFLSREFSSIIRKRTKVDKPGVDLSYLKSEKRRFYILYYAFVLIIVLSSFTSFYLDNRFLLLDSLFFLLGIVSLVFIIKKFKRVKYWINPRDILAIITLFLMLISIWGLVYIQSYIFFISIIGLFIWIAWFTFDVIRGNVELVKLVGFSGIVLIIVGFILDIIFASFYTSFVLYLGFYVWIGFFVSELLQRNKVPGLDSISESKIFEDLIRDSNALVEDGNKFYNKKEYPEAVDNWESSIIIYEKALELTPSHTQKEKIQSNIKELRENLINVLEESANLRNKKAIKAHKKQDLQEAEIEWKSAIQDFTKIIDIVKLEKLNINYSDIESKISTIRKNLEQLEIEKLCVSAEEKLERAQTLHDKNLTEAIDLLNKTFSLYSEALKKAKREPEFISLVDNIKTKMVNIRNYQSELQDKMDELIGITPLTTKVMIEDLDDTGYRKVEPILKAERNVKALTIVREYEFIGGQVRFKIGLINNTNNPLTNFRLIFDLPDALKWVIHEPNKYERKGDSVLISKLGKNEKKVVSLYLEPINCMESPINATVSFFDAKDRPQAIPMKPKTIKITCPIFFTKEKANLARVKKLQSSLTHRDKKIYPIINTDEISVIFSTVLLVLGEYDIKLISKEWSEKEKLGEAWFYGTTKVKKNRIITYVLLDGESKTLEIEVSADDEEKVTAFLAELGNKIRDKLLKYDLINSEEQFYDIRMSIHLNHCPYCWNTISAESIQEYLGGGSIKCKYCNEILSLKEKH